MIALSTTPAAADRGPHTPAHSLSLRRILALMATLLVAAAFVLGYLGTTNSASAAISAPSVTQCNGLFNGGGQGANCSVEVNNSLNILTGVESSSVTVTACNGSAADPTALCASETQSFTSLISSVNQCNASANLGGSVLTCDVTVTNTIIGEATPTAATVRQCNDADPSAVVCNPIGNTTNATVDQCNNSANGGGSLLTCTVATASTQTSAVPVTINQCNFSGEGGGSFVTCTASILNVVVPAEVSPEPTPSETPSTPPSTPPTGTPGDGTPTPGDGTPTPGGGTPVDGGTTSPTPVPTTPGGGGGNGDYDETTPGTLAATGPEGVMTLGLGALVLLFAGSLVLLARNLHRKPVSTPENH